MINLIKMNLYRLIHSKSTLIIVLVVVGLALFSSYMETTDNDYVMETREKEESKKIAGKEGPEDGTFGIMFNTTYDCESGRNPYILEFICADISSGLVLVIITIFTVIFVMAEHSSGFVKNIAGQVKGRWMLYLSKTIVVMIVTLIIMLFYSLIQASVLYVVLGNFKFGMDIIPDVLKFILTQWLLYSAFASSMVAAVSILHSTAIAITWGELSVFGLGQQVASFINHLIGKNEFDISKYFLTSNIEMLSWDSPNSKYADVLVLALIFFVVYNFVGMLWVSKRDVNV